MVVVLGVVVMVVLGVVAMGEGVVATVALELMGFGRWVAVLDPLCWEGRVHPAGHSITRDSSQHTQCGTCQAEFPSDVLLEDIAPLKAHTTSPSLTDGWNVFSSTI
jgi:hypothetical protein